MFCFFDLGFLAALFDQFDENVQEVVAGQGIETHKCQQNQVIPHAEDPFYKGFVPLVICDSWSLEENRCKDAMNDQGNI